ncbi:Putative carbohydrate-binding module family 19 [Colletotrichum destructivum]|uniref:Carbohydrate-binding module family 19 n=1 Tax=Colletotrichum destructivum TaxID=34406 RepID=A0AAX4I7M3_9PEZI|nr:Putative carbohydrate-binding module family 19 [Colletotrichum destructivum]
MRFSAVALVFLLSAFAEAQQCSTPGRYQCRANVFPAVCDGSGNWVILQRCPNNWRCIENNGSVYCSP